MKINMGNIDKIIRAIVVVGCLGLFFGGVVEGIYGYVLLAIAVIFTFTVTTGFCPIYSIFGLNSCPIKIEE